MAASYCVRRVIVAVSPDSKHKRAGRVAEEKAGRLRRVGRDGSWVDRGLQLQLQLQLQLRLQAQAAKL
jgi:hypothetical protein